MAQSRPELVYLTEQFPPYNFVEDGLYKGISTELLYLVWQRMNISKQKINVLPWERAYYLLQQQDNTVLFMTMQTPHRIELFKWACPIVSTELHFIGQTGSNYNVNAFSKMKAYKVAATRAAVGEQLLINKGFPIGNIVVTDNLEHSLKLLSRGRVDFVISETEAVDVAAKGLGLEDQAFKSYLLLSPVQGCFAFNRSVPDSFITEFETQLRDIVNSPLYENLLKRYSLDKKTER